MKVGWAWLLPWWDTVTGSTVLSPGVSTGGLEELVAEGPSVCFAGPEADVPRVVSTVSTAAGEIKMS